MKRITTGMEAGWVVGSALGLTTMVVMLASGYPPVTVFIISIKTIVAGTVLGGIIGAIALGLK